MSLGGTGDPPVLGGNLPPSFGRSALKPQGSCRRTQGGGRVARRNGPVARSTRIPIGALRQSLTHF